MKWQCSEPTERNENIVFWINWNGVNLYRMWGQGSVPCCALSTVAGDLFPTSVTVLPPLWLDLYLFIYFYLLRLEGLSMLGCFSETPCFTHIQLHTFTPLGAGVSPLLFTVRFYLTSQVLIASLWVTSTKVAWVCAGFFLLLCPRVPASGIWRNGSLVKSSALGATLTVGGETEKSFLSKLHVFCSSLCRTSSPCSVRMSKCQLWACCSLHLNVFFNKCN